MLMTRVAVVTGALALAFLGPVPGRSQSRQEPGHSIGSVSTQNGLIVMTLNEGALGKANMFDLARRTLRFTPEGAAYRVESGPLRWDSDFGAELTEPTAKLQHVAFPFSGKTWDTLSVGVNGSISFGPTSG